jgi:isopenicillin N synthase-like dioxygenase
MTIPPEPQIAHIPVIDLGVLRGENVSADAVDEVVKQIRAACVDTGFFQIINHGVSPELQQSVFQASKKLFELPRSAKMALERDPFGNRGYEILEGQSLDGAVEGHKKMESEYSGSDLKEGYYIGKDRSPDDPMVHRRFSGVNMWPPGIPEFPEIMPQYYNTMYDLAVEVMELIALYDAPSPH